MWKKTIWTEPGQGGTVSWVTKKPGVLGSAWSNPRRYFYDWSRGTLPEKQDYSDPMIRQCARSMTNVANSAEGALLDDLTRPSIYFLSHRTFCDEWISVRVPTSIFFIFSCRFLKHTHLGPRISVKSRLTLPTEHRNILFLTSFWANL